MQRNAGVCSQFSLEFSVECILVCSALKMSFSKNGHTTTDTKFQDIVYSKLNKWRVKLLKNVNKKNSTGTAQKTRNY